MKTKSISEIIIDLQRSLDDLKRNLDKIHRLSNQRLRTVKKLQTVIGPFQGEQKKQEVT